MAIYVALLYGSLCHLAALKRPRYFLQWLRSRSETTWPFMLPYCTAPYAIWLPKTSMLFFDNGLGAGPGFFMQVRKGEA